MTTKIGRLLLSSVTTFQSIGVLGKSIHALAWLDPLNWVPYPSLVPV
jgi:hypothetical protein